MVDWTKSMQQTFEYYIVDPGTWMDKQRLENVTSSSISRDIDSETLGSATIDVTESPGECYIRIYLIVIQNGNTERFPLGTYLVQTPSTDFNGKRRTISMDSYTPLLELKEKMPPIGYYIPKGTDIMTIACQLLRENMRAPFAAITSGTTLPDDFVANTDDTWLTFLIDLIYKAKYTFNVDECGKILFAPRQDLASMQPIWTYNDDNSSILYPELTVEQDLYGVPNAVEVIYSNGDNPSDTDTVCTLYAKVKNDDPNSPISTVNRGREILYRDTNPNLTGSPTREEIQDYAKRLLKDLSSIEGTISYTHGYCPVRVGDCVRLSYKRSGFEDIKARVVSQTIKCEPGCSVSEKAVFTINLWE